MDRAHELLSLPMRELLPHDEPMIFIDRMTEVNDDGAVSEVTLTSTHMCAVDGQIPSYVALEIMAQTIAGWSGFHDVMTGREPEVGFLLGTRKLTVDNEHLPLDRVLATHVEQEIRGDNGLSAFNCKILLGDAVIAEARINVFQPKTTNNDE